MLASVVWAWSKTYTMIPVRIKKHWWQGKKDICLMCVTHEQPTDNDEP